ncbi:polysaccharide deacetylase family protein [Streptomyces sp. NPDC058373]|uniref:polysaccharide deacetylase family protein n=1 Tax=unclassified Streptomyces TaxID=2593676 RepID=UPI003665ED7A
MTRPRTPAGTTTRRALLGAAPLAVAGLVAACARPVPDGRGADAAAPGPRNLAGLPVRIAHGPRDRDRVALTCHGGSPHPDAEPLLEAAGRAATPLTLLVTGVWLEREPGRARQALAAGHELGNHGWHGRPLDRLPQERARAEIAGCAERLRRLTGSPGAWFRAPGDGHATPGVVAAARAAGYPHLLGQDVDACAAADRGTAALVRAAIGPCRPGSVIALPLGHPRTAEALPLIAEELARRGLRPVTASRLLA